jgi:uncharacterized membrane protein YidH (DUF202 family)
MADEIKNTNEPLDPRVYFASERTLLAWIRTGLAMMGFGFVVARFGLFLREMATMRDVPPQSHSGLSLSAGTTLVIFGVVVKILAAVQTLEGHSPSGNGCDTSNFPLVTRYNRGILARLVRTADGDLPSGWAG